MLVRVKGSETFQRQTSRLPPTCGNGAARIHPDARGVTLVRGQRVRKDVPFLRHRMFVRERYSELRSVVERDPTLQFRYVRGGYCTPMTVRTAEMECFIRAVESTFRPRYYLPGEISPSMIGRQVLIVGGPLNGYEGHLLSIRGSRVKRLFIDLPGLLSAGVEVSPEYIRLL